MRRRWCIDRWRIRNGRENCTRGGAWTDRVATLNRVELGSLGLHGRDGALQRTGVRMLGLVKERARIRSFDDLAAIHDLNPIAETGDDAKVMRDKDHSHIYILLHLFD